MSDTKNDISKMLVEGTDEYNLSRDETLRQMIAQSFRGRMWWMSVVAWVYMFLFTGIAVVSAVMFFRVESTRDLILWATVFLTTLSFAVVTKMWYWTILYRNSFLREIKRLELRLAELAERVRG